MIYWFLCIVTATVAYLFGSLSSVTIASEYVFRKNLRKLGTGNVWLSNFRRVYGLKGAVKLLLVEILRDLIPMLTGALLLGMKGHGDVGYALAGFCLIMGRLYPVFNRLRGSHATVCLLVMAFGTDVSVGISVLVVTAAVMLLSRYLSLGTLAGALVFFVVTVLVVDTRLVVLLSAFTAAVIFFKHIPSIRRIANGREPRLSFEKDLSYKLDAKF